MSIWHVLWAVLMIGLILGVFFIPGGWGLIVECVCLLGLVPCCYNLDKKA